MKKWRRGNGTCEKIEKGLGFFLTNHVYCKFAQISVELSGETETRGDAGHCDGDEVIQIAISGRRQLQRSEANVVQGLVIDAVRFVSVFHQLMHFLPGSGFSFKKG